MTIEALTGLKNSENGPVSVTKAIRQAAGQTGMDFDLLLGVAKRESSLRADARAATSSASGLFQFIDQTWLGSLKEHGDALGLGDYARDIERTDKGYSVADPARRDEILNLRFKPAIAAKVAGKTLAEARERLTAALGREVSGSEVYMAHFLGERGALRMLKAGEDAVAADVDPRAASANQTLFFQNGRALNVSEFKDKIALHLGTDTAPEAPVSVPGPYRPKPPVAIDTYAKPSVRSNGFAPAGLPPQLHAAIVEMQSNFIFGRKDS